MIRFTDRISVSIFSVFALAIVLVTDFSVFTVIFLSAVVLHEISHLVLLRLFGVNILKLSIYPFGIDIECDMRKLDYGKELICILSGSFSNLLFAFVGRVLFIPFPSEKVLFFVFCNLFLGLCNLIPVSVFDGGRALFIIIDWIFLPDTAYYIEKVLDILGFILSFFLLFLVLSGNGFNLSLVAAMIYGFISGTASKKPAGV